MEELFYGIPTEEVHLLICKAVSNKGIKHSKEDFIQEAWVKVIESMDRFNPEKSKITTWIYNTTFMHLAKSFHKVKGGSLYEANENRSGATSFEEELLNKIEIENFISKQKPKEQFIIRKKLQGCVDDEISKELGITKAAVNARWVKAVRPGIPTKKFYTRADIVKMKNKESLYLYGKKGKDIEISDTPKAGYLPFKEFFNRRQNLGFYNVLERKTRMTKECLKGLCQKYNFVYRDESCIWEGYYNKSGGRQFSYDFSEEEINYIKNLPLKEPNRNWEGAKRIKGVSYFETNSTFRSSFKIYCKVNKLNFDEFEEVFSHIANGRNKRFFYRRIK